MDSSGAIRSHQDLECKLSELSGIVTRGLLCLLQVKGIIRIFDLQCKYAMGRLVLSISDR